MFDVMRKYRLFRPDSPKLKSSPLGGVVLIVILTFVIDGSLVPVDTVSSSFANSFESGPLSMRERAVMALSETDVSCEAGNLFVFDGSKWTCQQRPRRLPVIHQSHLAQPGSVHIDDQGRVHALLKGDLVGQSVDFSNSLDGDVKGQQKATIVTALQGHAVSSLQPNDKDLLIWSGVNQEWQPSSAGGRELVAEVVANDSSEIKFDEYGSDYAYFEIEMDGVVTSASSVNLQLQVSTDNGTSWISTGYKTAISGWRANYTSFNMRESTNATHIYLNQPSNYRRLNGSSLYPYHGKVTLYNLFSTSENKLFRVDAAFIGSGAHRPLRLIGNGAIDTLLAVDAIRIQLSSGNISSGRFRLYGVK